MAILKENLTGKSEWCDSFLSGILIAMEDCNYNLIFLQMAAKDKISLILLLLFNFLILVSKIDHGTRKITIDYWKT